MNEKIIALWGFIIILLVGIICFVGIHYEDEIEYIKLKEEVKDSVKKYIKSEDAPLPLEITTEELEEKKYIKELKLDEKVCAADVKVKKVFWVFKSYDIDFTCINPNINN